MQSYIWLDPGIKVKISKKNIFRELENFKYGLFNMQN